MKAAVLYGREDVRLEEVPLPEVGPGQVRVRIRTALTCGTDIKVYRRGYHAHMITPPSVFGHELAGEIEAVGEGVRGWSPGMRVAVANSAPCGRCFYCRRAEEELCEDLLFLNGAYAEYVTIPARIVRCNLHSIPETVPFDHAALTEPLACVVHGMAKTGVAPGDTVAVLGTGPIGLMFIALCRRAGARVIACGRGRARLDKAIHLGADLALSSLDVSSLSQEVRKVTEGGRGADRVIECVGRTDVWEQAIAMARRGGLVNLFGGCERGTRVQVLTERVHYDEVTLTGAFHHTPAAVREALRLIGDGAIPAASLVDGRSSLEEVPAVLRAMADGSALTKVAVHP